MTGRILVVLCILFPVGFALPGIARAYYPEGKDLATRSFAGPEYSGFEQIQMATPTPQVIDTDQQENPIHSEVGKDVGLVVGAAVLVLIVIAGLLIGYSPNRKRKLPRKTRD
jgi:hypothetical protein